MCTEFGHAYAEIEDDSEDLDGRLVCTIPIYSCSNFA